MAWAARCQKPCLRVHWTTDTHWGRGWLPLPSSFTRVRVACGPLRLPAHAAPRLTEGMLWFTRALCLCFLCLRVSVSTKVGVFMSLCLPLFANASKCTHVCVRVRIVMCVCVCVSLARTRSSGAVLVFVADMVTALCVLVSPLLLIMKLDPVSSLLSPSLLPWPLAALPLWLAVLGTTRIVANLSKSQYPFAVRVRLCVAVCATRGVMCV